MTDLDVVIFTRGRWDDARSMLESVPEPLRHGFTIVNNDST